MNPKTAALKSKLGSVGKAAGSLVGKAAKKVVDVGGDYIANHVMVKPTLDKMRGDAAARKTEYLKGRLK